MPHRSAGIVVGKAQKMQKLNSIPVCHMNKNFNQTAGLVAPKSYPSRVVKATNIAMEASKLDINLTCPKDMLLNM